MPIPATSAIGVVVLAGTLALGGSMLLRRAPKRRIEPR
jgi:hypothetical protein